jgi:membrane protein DedA with SNARE-associated domain
MTQWWMGALVVLLAATLGYYIRFIIGRYAAKTSEQRAQRLLEDAKRDADSTRQPC